MFKIRIAVGIIPLAILMVLSVLSELTARFFDRAFHGLEGWIQTGEWPEVI